jgi:hypothetical protein
MIPTTEVDGELDELGQAFLQAVSSFDGELSQEDVQRAQDILGVPVQLLADFNNDLVVNFDDLFIFADGFGQLAEGVFAILDLSKNGEVDINDFFIFFDSFGHGIGKVVIGEALPAVDGALRLEASATETGLQVSVHSTDLLLSGYAVVVEYDPAAFRLREVVVEQSVLRSVAGEPLLMSWEESGEVMIWSSRTGGAGNVEGLLAALHFESLTAESAGLFRIREAVVRQAGGQLAQPRQLGEIEMHEVPQMFALHANYPNPFNPSTTIHYQLPASSQVRLELYDVLGQKVRTLVHGAQSAGHYQAVWDGRNEVGDRMAAGVYFYRLQAGEFIQVRKLLLMK